MLLIKPLAWLFRCVGIAPSRSSTDKYISLVMIIVVLFQSVHTMTNMKNIPNAMMNALLTICLGFVVLNITGFLVYNFFCGDSYQKILRELQNGENELQKIGAKPGEPNNMQYISVWCLLFFAIFRAAMAVLSGTSGFGIIPPVFIPTLLTTALTQHLVLVSQLHAMFSALNDQLRRFSAAADDTVVEVMSAQLQSVFRIHTSLQATVSNINGHFFIYNFFATASRLLFIVINMYGYLVSLSENHPFFNAQKVVLVVEMTKLVVQCVLCHACAKEANRTVLLAHHILQPHTPLRLWLEVGDFSRLCIDDKVHFTAGGVFTLDRSLITKICVLALSYLIVVVQLQDVQIFEDHSPPPSTTLANFTDFGNFSTEDYYSF